MHGDHEPISSRGSSAMPPRRSRRSNAGERQERLYVSNLTDTWRRVYLDMNHCRLQKCIRKIKVASSSEILELQEMGTSFVSMAISAASAYGASKEDRLLDYARVVTERGLNVNDVHNGNSALVSAAYHGYVRLLDYLISLGCSLDSHGSYGNAIQASVRNGQHQALVLLLERRPRDVSSLLKNDRFSVALQRAICKGDVESVRILTTTSGIVQPTMSDASMAGMKHKGDEKRFLWPLLQTLYPLLPNAGASWNKNTHWSFPTSDRHALNILWSTIGVHGRFIPSEIWLIVFSFVGRGWFSTEGTTK